MRDRAPYVVVTQVTMANLENCAIKYGQSHSVLDLHLTIG
jgi:hypothetical protein